MRKSAFEGNLLRLLRNEIHYELEHSPPSQPVPEFNSFTVDERQGEQWIRLSAEEEVTLHITLIVDIYKGEGNEVLEFVCSAWPDSIEIRKIFMRSRDQMAGQPYMGPGFKGLDDELQESLYEFLEARGIDDDLAAFLHEYMKNKDKTEFIQWMGTVKTFIEKK
ncbi:mitochondrial glycoprotein family protein [Actinidia rufa]|uniref:Mitochondrial glycoprotein family protein n=1 Tax=Actinidia rufa TaxID=165716 RepID=A0A7J0H2J2_9ERIC|nr:mitochondrial glycoprotein family protein [Actinidia rufa]